MYLFANAGFAVGESSRLCPLLLFVQLQRGEERVSSLHFLSAFREVRGKLFLSSLTCMVPHFVMLFTALLQLFFLALLGSWGGLFQQLFFLLIDLIPL